jgi:hypothetical protein
MIGVKQVTDVADLPAHYRAFRSRPPPYLFKIPRMLRMQAKEIAAAFYDEADTHLFVQDGSDGMMTNPYGQIRSVHFRMVWPSQKLYVAWCWPLFVKDARTTLATMLGRRDVSEHMKEEIYVALQAEIAMEGFNNHLAPYLIGL